MKTFCVLLAASLCFFSCRQKQQVSLPLVESRDQEWATYEGNVLLPDGELMEMELTLREASPGIESSYKLNGMLVTEQYASVVHSKGSYEVMPLGGGQFGIRLLGVETGIDVASGAFITRNIDRLRKVPNRPNNYKSIDFSFVTDGNGRLVLTDDDFARRAIDDTYTLFRRSDLFTIEGYVTVDPDCTLEFFERNTMRNWPVARLGVYRAIEENYADLAKEQWEGIYLRAVAYSVSDTTDGKQSNLVVKKLIAMGNRE